MPIREGFPFCLVAHSMLDGRKEATRMSLNDKCHAIFDPIEAVCGFAVETKNIGPGVILAAARTKSNKDA
jgi:hypothetical protein